VHGDDDFELRRADLADAPPEADQQWNMKPYCGG
jgi:hypothetical protein